MAFKPLTDSLHKLTDRVYGSLSLFVFLFLSIGAALWLGTFFEHMFVGFLLIGAFYAIIFIFMFIYGRKLIERKLLLMFSGLVYDEHDIEPKLRAEMEIQEFGNSLIKEEITNNEI